MPQRNIAIVLAGGQGSRMNCAVPKQYMELLGKTVLYYSLKCMQDSFIDEIILVSRHGDVQMCREEFVEKYGFDKITAIVEGGKERYDSVYNGLAAACAHVGCPGDTYIYIHDGARPCIDAALMEECRRNVVEYGACIPAVPVKDTIKISDDDGFCGGTLPRDRLMSVQTPQCFRLDAIFEAYRIMHDRQAEGTLSEKITDDAAVMEMFGKMKVKLCKGSYDNLKVTTPEDIERAQQVLKHRM